MAETTHAPMDAEARNRRCVVAWFESRSHLFHFFWREVSSPDTTPQKEAHLLEVSPRSVVVALMTPELAGQGDGCHGNVLHGLSAAEHSAFADALAATSAPASLITLESDTNPLSNEQHAELLRRVLLSRGHEQQKQKETLCSGPFALAAKRLGPGSDRRVLQMAVQYLAQGGIDESVVAAHYDQEDFLEGLKRELGAKRVIKPN